MKKIGILFGMEDTFPWAVIDRINQKGKGKYIAEPVRIGEVSNHKQYEYAVIIDRISQDVPFYRAYLKNAALTGTAVINNPFWWSADEKYFNYTLTQHLGIPTPKTILIPSHERPTDTTDKSFRNLEMMNWDAIFNALGFPFYMKPYSGGGWKNVYKITSPEDFFKSYAETGQLVMTLQENIDFTEYYRCYGLGNGKVHIMPYEPRNPHHLRYSANFNTSDQMKKTITDLVRKINTALGYDFNTCEFAVRDGIPYAIDFGNPAPDAEYNSVGAENFEWIVENAASYAIERAEKQEFGKTNLTWGSFMRGAVADTNF